MNNPDERTAVDQFGKGDKYFGICTLMVDPAWVAHVRSWSGGRLYRKIWHGIYKTPLAGV